PIAWTSRIGASNHGKISEHCLWVGAWGGRLAYGNLLKNENNWPVENRKMGVSDCSNLSSRVHGDSAEGGNRSLVGRHDVREAVRPPTRDPGRPPFFAITLACPLILRVRPPWCSAVCAWRAHIVLAERRLAEHRTSPQPPSLAPPWFSRPRVRCVLRKNLRPIPMHSRLGRAAIADRPGSRDQTAVRSRR